MIGRLGRSLRVHLLLASQRLEENKLRGLDSHLSYRIGLRTFSANESRQVLGITDAYHLPSQPGAAYLKSRRPRSAAVQGRLRLRCLRGGGSHGELPQAGGVGGGPTVHAAGASPPAGGLSARGTGLAAALPEPTRCSRDPDGPARRSHQPADGGRPHQGPRPPAHEVWLPPLDVSPTVDMLHPALDPDRRGHRDRHAEAADRHHRQALRAAARRAHRRSGRARRQRRRGRRSAVGQVDRAAHPDHGAAADPHRRSRCSSTASTSVAARSPAWRPAACRLGRGPVWRATGCAAPSPK